MFNTLQLASLDDFTYNKLPAASNPAYLTESDEIVLSEAVKAKAAELQYDPVKIYHWVRNNIVWMPSWGGIQNADLTLSAQRGNAMDIAGLTIALLRASKIPARYVHGTIDVPADAFVNWAGGFATVQAASAYAANGGIPVANVLSGGKIAKVRIEHIWVEAAIDFHPSRGAKNKDADSWASLDPSFKQYEHQKGLDAVALSGIDPEQLAQSFVDSGTVNDSESWATGFNGQILQDAQTQAQQKLQDYVQNQMQNPTVGDVIGGAKTIIQEYPVLPSSLPNRIVAIGARYDKLPVSLQQHIRYSFGKDIEGYMIDPVDFPFAKVNNQKLTLSFKPATDADEQTLLSLLPDGEITDVSQLPSSIPSYLIRVIPELKLNGQVVKSGSAMKLGEEVPFVTGVSFAGRGEVQSPRTYNVIAGSYLSVNAIAGNVSPNELNHLKTALEQTKTKLESQDQQQIAALTREELLGDLFRAGSLGYYAQLIGLSHVMGL
ncbi:MAG: transglutaminase-like domain-containing protein, partial [Gammaproteobacteria bacterium]